MIRDPVKHGIVISSPEEEAARIIELHSLNILGTKPEESFDRISSLVAKIFKAPIALVSLMDREQQWFKSCIGLTMEGSPREVSFCQYTVALKQVQVIENTLEDDRFKNNPFVIDAGIRFYAGAPLISKDGYVLGSLCILDYVPRTFHEDDIKVLEEFAQWVMSEIQLKSVLDEVSKDLTTAATLQRELLPKNSSSAHCNVYGVCHPAQVVSGDFYDYYWHGNDRLFGYVVDIMGHGTATALQASALRVLFAQAASRQESLGGMLQWINQASIPFMPEGYYFTAIVFELNFKQGIMRYSSGGINKFYKCHAGASETIRVKGMPLGLFSQAQYHEISMEFVQGDGFIFCSDGFYETVQESDHPQPIDWIKRIELGLLKAPKDDQTALYIDTGKQ